MDGISSNEVYMSSTNEAPSNKTESRTFETQSEISSGSCEIEYDAVESFTDFDIIYPSEFDDFEEQSTQIPFSLSDSTNETVVGKSVTPQGNIPDSTDPMKAEKEDEVSESLTLPAFLYIHSGLINAYQYVIVIIKTFSK